MWPDTVLSSSLVNICTIVLSFKQYVIILLLCTIRLSDHVDYPDRQLESLTASLLTTPTEIRVLPDTLQSDTFTRLASVDEVLPNLTDLKIAPARVILIRVAEFIQCSSLPVLLQLVQRLKQNANVRQLFLWINPSCVLSATDSHVIVPYLEHMSGAVITLRDATNLQVLTKKAGGAVGQKYYTYTVSSSRFETIETQKPVLKRPVDESVNPESLTTFKINFEDEELEARTALKLPYERTTDAPAMDESRIIYTPDADDDFDEEDPDDDLNI